MSNTTGQLYRITTFGESHGPGVGCVIDGCPAGVPVDPALIQQQLTRRRPGQSRLTTPRNEADELEILSGVYNGRALGTPIAVLVRNTNNKGKDYDRWARVYRPSHADYTYHIKYGYRTPHGGGRASVRETIGRVAAGALAEQILKHDLGIEIVAWVESIAGVSTPIYRQLVKEPGTPQYDDYLQRDAIDASLVRCPDPAVSDHMIQLIEEARKEGNSLGGTIGLIVRNVPPGLGEPVFDKLEAELGKACLSISACKGFESGSGFDGTRMFGSDHNDIFYNDNDPDGEAAATVAEGGPVNYRTVPDLRTHTNRSGGIQGGITNGMPVLLRLAFKPVATIQQFQETVNEFGETEELRPGGRHDPCVLPRAVPIVETVAANVLMDMYLRQRAINPAWWERYVRPEARQQLEHLADRPLPDGVQS